MKTKIMIEKPMSALFFICGMVTIAAVIIISAYMIISGIPAIREIGLTDFLFGRVWKSTASEPLFGILPFILASVYGILGACLIGVPVGLMTAIFLAKVASPKIAQVVNTAVELLSGIPSVVYGLIGMIVLVPAIMKTFNLKNGTSLLAAIIVLAVMILPSIISVSRTALSSVPKEYEEASCALGATKMETIFKVSVPAAKSGIAAGIVLGIGRAIGEAMAVIMVAGNVANMPGLFKSVTFLTTSIAKEMSYASGLQRRALYSIALVLFVFIMIINNSACVYLQCGKDAAGKNILHCTQNFDFLHTVEDTLSGGAQKTFMDMKQGGRIIETELTAVCGQRGISGGLIVTMTDVTASRNAQKMRRDFFSNASHELKTPITSIKGSVELLCADIPVAAEQQKELISRIGIETGRMHNLINDIIMLSRIESGELAVDKENIDLAAVIRECCDEAEPLAEQSKLRFHLKLSPTVLYASRKNMYELVSNLIINAVKYNRVGGSIDISAANRGSEIVLSVRNDGEPIPLEHQPRVFERFYRVDKGRSKTAGGTGLGLSIVKHVVDSLGGAIILESGKKEGTRFTVMIPVSGNREI